MSPDSLKAQLKFSNKLQLRFPLLADPDHRIGESYGVWGEKSFMGRKYMGVSRVTFVIDRDGLVRRVFDTVKPKGHASEVLDAVRQNG